MNKNSKRMLQAAIAASFATALLAPGLAVSASSAYWYDSDGDLWHNTPGECWRTGTWTADQALPECEGGEVAEPAPAPAPVPRPAAPRDSDGDGVIDSADACPGTPAGVRVDARGCELQERISLEGVTFATNSAVLDPTSVQTLDDVVTTLRRYPELKVEVQGHTDSSGNRDYNISLSQQRADAVRMYLINKGINSSRLSARGYGPDQPVASNETATGRAQNRRVELAISE